MKVGIADSCGVELEEKFVWAGSWDLYILDRDGEVCAAFADTSCTAGRWNVFVVGVLGLGADISLVGGRDGGGGSLSAPSLGVDGHGLLVLGEWVGHFDSNWLSSVVWLCFLACDYEKW